MKQHYRILAANLVFVLILFSGWMKSQVKDADVHFRNDSTRSGEVLSVGDSSIAVLWLQRKQSSGPQDLPIDQIKTISFTNTTAGDASTLAKLGGSAAGIVVGGAVGFGIGYVLVPPPQGLVQVHWGAGLFAIIGAVGGYSLGAEVVNPSTHQEIRLDPKIPLQRDSLRVYLRPQ
jgi:hypothetical protein